MTIRLLIKSATRFVRWCERERMSYREEFDRLLNGAHIPE